MAETERQNPSQLSPKSRQEREEQAITRNANKQNIVNNHHKDKGATKSFTAQEREEQAFEMLTSIISLRTTTKKRAKQRNFARKKRNDFRK